MSCPACKKNPVIANPFLCKEHFIAYFEKKTLFTIQRFNLFSKKSKICVAVSGGKDSMALLYVLHKYYPFVHAVIVDEGIKGYRNHTLNHLKKFCKKHKISLSVHSFKKDAGMSLDALMKTKKHPCTVCGVLRRKILNSAAQEFEVLALGHNLDDEAQTVIMNLCTNKPDLLLLQRPKSPLKKGFVQRVKPFCLLKEKEVLLYAVLLGLAPSFVECPYMHDALRNAVRDALNAEEEKNFGTKQRVYETHLEVVERFLSRCPCPTKYA